MSVETKLGRVIRIEINERSLPSGKGDERETLFVAKSPDLNGLLVTADDLAALFDGLPISIEKHLAALGTRMVVARAQAELPGYTAYIAMPVGIAENALRRSAELV